MTNEQEVIEPEVVEETGQDLIRRHEIKDMSVLSELTRAEVDIQVSTAKKYPRSIETFQADLYTLATMDQETAASMFYGMKRGNKFIEGPSVRFAEIVAYSWTNLRSEGRVIDIGPKILTAQGVCWDMERNVGSRIEVQRRITNRKGERYNDDMIVVAGNAAVSIAIRNAIFDVIPAVLARKAYTAALKVAAGGSRPIEERRDLLLGDFAEMDVDAEDVYRILGIKGKADMGAKEIRRLIGIKNAINDGDTTVENVFADPRAGSDELGDLNTKLRARSKERENSAEKAAEPVGTTTPAPEVPQAESEQQGASEPKPPTPAQKLVYDEATDLAEELATADKLDWDDSTALSAALEARDMKTLKKIRDKLQVEVGALEQPTAAPEYRKPVEGAPGNTRDGEEE